MKKIFTPLLLISILFFQESQSQQVSFPGAEGAGRFTTGGRGTPTTPTTVLEVTNLKDDNNPGSLRYALNLASSTAPHRTIVFRVSGTIHLTSPLNINRANTTIAGQTAPGGGICIADYPVSLSASNVIVRHIRFRLGDKNQAARLGNDDAFSGTGRKNIIIDHCTMSWSNDETFTVYGGDSTTLQWNMISEPLDSSYHDEGSGVQRHGYGGIWGGMKASFHHNLIAHVRGRAPRFDGSRNLPNSSTPVAGSENADFRNNVIYNWVDYNVNGGEGGNYNVVNNYYKYGPNTLNSSTAGVNRRTMVINPYRQSSPLLEYGKFFLEGNYVDGSPTVTARNWLGAAMNGGSLNDTTRSKVTTPFVIAPIETETAEQAFQSVLNGAGAILPKRDTLDQRIVRDVLNRTGRIINVQGGYERGTPYAITQAAWPKLDSLAAPTDTDKDGMSDAWEIRRGLNPNSAIDRNGYNANGYTNLENYLNGDSIVAMGVNNSCIASKAVVTNGLGGWKHATDTSYAISMSTDTLNVIASILNTRNSGGFNVSYYTTNTLRYINSKPYLGRNITIEALNPSAITNPVKVRLYISQQEYNALVAADNTITGIESLKVVKTNSNTCITALSGNYEVIDPTAAGVFGTYANGYFIEFETATFSTFFIAGPSIALPLQLVSFNGSYDGSKVSLQWKTQNEVNTASFKIEKSTDGSRFSAIGNVAAAGNAFTRTYSFTDPAKLDGTGYYRLRMIDKDGKFTVSRILTFKAISKNGFVITPNPANSFIQVSHNKAIAGATIWITTIDGKVLMQQKLSTGAVQTVLSTSMLSSGAYMIVLENGGEKSTQQLLKN